MLAISSSLFIAIAAITGIILAFEPISEQLHSYYIEDSEQQSLAKTIQVLQDEYDEVLSITKDHNDFVVASVITKEGKNDTFYIDPTTGKKLGALIPKKPIFKFATNLHRSLFLKSIGRFFVALCSLLLLLIACSGIVLIIQRQGGIFKFFSKIVYENFHQYYHVVFGRFTLLPIVILTFTGIYLSLDKFDLLPTKTTQITSYQETASASKVIAIKDFPVFNAIPLANIRSVEFPFSKDVEDYFVVNLKDKEIDVHQYSGKIIEERLYPFSKIVLYYSLILHTGQGSMLWAIIILIATCAILFFLFSGFTMTLKRKKQSITTTNLHAKDDAEFIILVASENGSTFEFATNLYNALIASRKSVFMDELNAYTTYEKAKQLIVLAATFGDGDAPTNAKNFVKKLEAIQPIHPLKYAVVGFGSTDYPEFCAYAETISKALETNSNFTASTPLYKINDKSYDTFLEWSNLWSKHEGIQLQMASELKTKKEIRLKVTQRSSLNTDDTFLLELKTPLFTQFTSGDLLSFTPKGETKERLYSIAKNNCNRILLSIKKHEFGVCSSYFSQLQPKDTFTGKIQDNPSFHFPETTKPVVFIANGTGIAPFLGMIQNKKNKAVQKYLFWGGRTMSSYNLYKTMIDNALKKGNLANTFIAYSQEVTPKKYVQDSVLEQADLIAKVLQRKGTIMICGSIVMLDGVMQILERITTQYQLNLEDLIANGHIKSDCY